MKDIGIFLAGVWFVGTGLISLFGLRFNGMGMVMGAIALIAGVLLLVRR